jgi:hypothetical protein
MPLDPTNYLRACDDAFLRVVDEEGTLLGCIPSPGNQDLSSVTIRDQDGRVHELWFGLVAAVVVNLHDGELPTRLYEFTPITGLDEIVRRKLSREPIPGDSPDIGREPIGR